MKTIIKRRFNVSQNTAEELMIREVVSVIEKMPPDIRLYHCVEALGKAREHLADYIDNVPFKYPATEPFTPYKPMCGVSGSKTQHGIISSECGFEKSPTRRLLEVLCKIGLENLTESTFCERFSKEFMVGHREEIDRNKDPYISLYETITSWEKGNQYCSLEMLINTVFTIMLRN